MAGFQFDLNSLMQDPNFIGGIGLLGGSSPRMQPLLGAYQLLRENQAAKTANEQKQMALDIQNRHLGVQQQIANSTGEYQKAEAEAQKALVEKRGQEVEVMQRKLDQQEKMQNAMMALIQKAYPGMQIPGLTPPAQPEAAPTTPLQRPMSAPMGPTGKYGTPVSILDSLQKVESGGNPFAVGPDIGGGVRARGAYQFLPTTQKMLEPEIGKFDPFNPQQSRDAADFYIQKLVKQNGGDYRKALAQYGGFKSQDSTNYVDRVMTGSPESVVKQRTQATNAQQQSQQAGNLAPTLLPSIKFGENGMSMDFNPSFEPNKLAIEQQRLGLAQNQDVREAAKARREEELHPGAVVKQGADIAHTNAQTTHVNQQTATAQQKVQEERAMSKNSHDAITEAVDAASNQIDSLIKDPGLPAITGRAAITNRFAVPGGAAYGALSKLKSIQSKLIQDTLQATRTASKNGASGYGQFTEKELEVVKTYLDNLDPGRPDFLEALGNVKARLQQIKSRQGEFYRATVGPAIGTSEGGYKFKGGDPSVQSNWEKE